ncbi:MAG: hypothetical protein R3D61_04705 [Defluviimonas denitrificans]
MATLAVALHLQLLKIGGAGAGKALFIRQHRADGASQILLCQMLTSASITGMCSSRQRPARNASIAAACEENRRNGLMAIISDSPIGPTSNNARRPNSRTEDAVAGMP